MKNLTNRVKKAGKVVLSMVAISILQIKNAFCSDENPLVKLTNAVTSNTGYLYTLMQVILGIVMVYSVFNAIQKTNAEDQNPKKSWIAVGITAIGIAAFQMFKS